MVIIGGAAGVVGALLTSNYLQPVGVPYDSYIYGPGNPTPANQIPELRRIEKFLGIEQDFEVQNALQRLNPSIVGIYSKTTTIPSGITATLENDLRGFGFVLTNDGWVVTSSEIVGPQVSYKIVYNNQFYDGDEVLIDQATGLAFVKTPIRDAAVALLGDSEELGSGQIVLGVGDYGQVYIGETIDSNYHPRTLSALQTTSELYNEYIQTNIADSLLKPGLPIANLGGEIVGIATSNDVNQAVVVPINQIKDTITSVLKEGSIIRPLLGVSYIDLYHGGIGTDVIQKGAQVVARPAAGTPAAIAGIAVGDILFKIDSQLITARRSLSEIIQGYRPGDTITVHYIRDGETINVDILLQEKE